MVAEANNALAELMGNQGRILACDVDERRLRLVEEQARRLGDALQIGTYELIERMVGLLHGLEVPDVGTLDFRSVDNLFTGTVDRQGLAVYGVRFALPMTALPPAAVALDDFETFDAQYDLPPLADDDARQAWLAGNYGSSRPDAHDTVVLPIAP